MKEGRELLYHVGSVVLAHPLVRPGLAVAAQVLAGPPLHHERRPVLPRRLMMMALFMRLDA